ncbi:MAG: ABC transporter ATP-binding protein [Thermaerobacter sp.]|nr:mannosyltransferase [Bacillota bacterium]REJ37756.1 MAG: mannosyltransferase [Bacillota bacterium]
MTVTTPSAAAREGVPAIRLRGATRTFAAASGSRYTAVQDVTLDIDEGRFVAVVGPSGCGKSTILNMVAGLMEPTSGTVEIYGERLQGINPRAGYIFQQDALLPWKTVIENVMLGLILRGVPRKEARAQGMAWLERVGLAPFADRFPYQLSGGMRKRVTIAQHWVTDPDILLMDEPFSALDVQTRQMMEAELLAIWSGSRKTVMFVTHDLEEAIALADEVVVMSAGPASRVVGRYTVDLPRPRNLMDIRMEPHFMELYGEIWSRLREEVLKSHERSRALGRQ